jgi:hypothetical protein
MKGQLIITFEQHPPKIKALMPIGASASSIAAVQKFPAADDAVTSQKRKSIA